MKNYTTNDFYNIVVNELPLIDVRAPIEFVKGAFINATNLPLMNDEERHLVGICYKQKGNEEAVKLGNTLVSGEIKEERIKAWLDELSNHPDALLYCFRGGQRSQITQQWISDASGLKIKRLEGGYKAFRNYLLEQLDPALQPSKPIILGGYTGSGKTILLKKVEYAVDLEGIANHRGSSFGNFPSPQPTQINFDNNLAYALIQHRHKNYSHMLLEDEGRNVGKCFMPKPLVAHYAASDMVILEAPMEDRVSITIDEYVVESQKSYIELHGEEKGLEEWATYINSSIDRVQKRLGPVRHKLVSDLFNNAYKNQLSTGNYDAHCDWVQFFLEKYYDPMYQYQIDNMDRKILFKGNHDDLLEFLITLK